MDESNWNACDQSFKNKFHKQPFKHFNAIDSMLQNKHATGEFIISSNKLNNSSDNGTVNIFIYL